MSKGNYHSLHSCNKCGKNTNKITEVVDTINGHTAECRTKCKSCGFEDYWAYGIYESGEYMESKCERY